MAEIKKTIRVVEKALQEQENGMNFMRDWMRRLEIPDEKSIMEIMRAEIPEIHEIQPETPEMIRDKLETLKEDERLDASAIRGLEKMMKNIAPSFGSRPMAVGAHFYQPTILTTADSANDTNTSFDFGQKPSLVIVNGAQYRENFGWTWINNKVELDNPAGQVGLDGNIYAIL